ncbi:MAG: phosphoserine phosphatase SerB [Alphaproteobacteria bacterium]
MICTITLVSDPQRKPITERLVRVATDAALTAGGELASAPAILSPERAVDLFVSGVDRPALSRALEIDDEFDGVDVAVQPADGRRKKVLVADMDSTMIRNETLDTLAAHLGFGDQVAEITARSMAGELDFLESLRERVALLKGYPAESSMAVVMDAIVHTPGAERAVKTMVRNGALCALVSGGFTFTTSVVHAQLGFQEHHANTLEIGDDGNFTGRLTGDQVGPSTKLDIMKALCARQGVDLDMAAGVGDGANDIPMLRAAGLGVGYYPKPIVRGAAAFRIEHTDMTTLAYFQGYSDEEIAG